jgi:hypothetical protein
MSVPEVVIITCIELMHLSVAMYTSSVDDAAQVLSLVPYTLLK